MAVVDLDWNPSRGKLRTFGVAGLVAFGLLGAMAYGRLLAFHAISAETGLLTAKILWGVGVYCGIFGVIAPVAVKPIYLLLTVITYPIGFVVSYLLLAIMFYLVLLPVGLVFKIIGRDAMTRRFDPDAKTYWVVRRPPESMKRYFRQF